MINQQPDSSIQEGPGDVVIRLADRVLMGVWLPNVAPQLRTNNNASS
jgi:hypothetical protein